MREISGSNSIVAVSSSQSLAPPGSSLFHLSLSTSAADDRSESWHEVEAVRGTYKCEWQVWTKQKLCGINFDENTFHLFVWLNK